MTHRSALLSGVALWMAPHDPLPAGFWSKCQSIVSTYLAARAMVTDPVKMAQLKKMVGDS